MDIFSVESLKESMLNLYCKKDEISNIAYRIAFDMLEEKIGYEKLDQFLTAHNIG